LLKLLKSIFSGDWVKDVIDNFDPHGIKAIIDVELNKQYNEEEPKLNSKEK
jgi:hypothetical protein